MACYDGNIFIDNCAWFWYREIVEEEEVGSWHETVSPREQRVSVCGYGVGPCSCRFLVASRAREVGAQGIFLDIRPH